MVIRAAAPPVVENPALLTILFVMIAEVLIFVPTVANFRMTWLKEKLNTAAAASVLISSDVELELPLRRPGRGADGHRRQGHRAALRREGALHPAERRDPAAAQPCRRRRVQRRRAIRDAFETLLFGGDRYLRVFGPIGETDNHIEMILPDGPLRDAMLIYARNVAVLSLIIALITASLVFLAINRIAIRPVRRMTAIDAAVSRSIPTIPMR